MASYAAGMQSPTRQRRLPPQERRRVIEEAAAHEFAERGYEAARLDDIAAASGVTKPMLYRHFASKRALYTAVLSLHRDALAHAALTPFVTTEGPLKTRVVAMLDGWYRYVQEHPHVAPLLFQGVASDPEMKRFLSDLHAQQRAADIALFHEAGAELPDPLLEPLAEVVRSSLTGLALWWLERPDLPRQTLVNTMLRVIEAIVPLDDR